MKTPLRWSIAYAAYFSFLGLWFSFGPAELMRLDPRWAPASLASLSLAYFIATPLSSWAWRVFGFSAALGAFGALMGLFLTLPALHPNALVWSAPIAFLFSSGAYTLCETKMIEELAKHGRGHEFGHSRKWGSAGFLVAAALGGSFISWSGHERAVAFGIAACALAFTAACMALALAGKDQLVARPTEPAIPTDEPVPEEAEPQAETPSERAASRELPSTAFFGCATIASMRLAEAIATTWFGAFWLATGHSAAETGLLCALPVAAEFLAMWKGSRFLRPALIPALIAACAGASCLRWIITPLCETAWCAAPLQAVHALSFGLFYPASLLWLKHQYGERFFSTRYLLEGSSRALGAVSAYAAAAFAIAAFGYASMFWLAAALAGLCCIWWSWLVAKHRTARPLLQVDP